MFTMLIGALRHQTLSELRRRLAKMMACGMMMVVMLTGTSTNCAQCYVVLSHALAGPGTYGAIVPHGRGLLCSGREQRNSKYAVMGKSCATGLVAVP